MKKKFNWVKLISIVLIAGGVAYGGSVLTIYVVNKYKDAKQVVVSRPRPKTQNTLQPKTLDPSNEPAFSPSFDKISKKVDTVTATINKLAPTLSTIGGLLLLLFNIRKAKREDEKLKLQVEAAVIETAPKKSPTQYPKRKKSPTKTGK